MKRFLITAAALMVCFGIARAAVLRVPLEYGSIQAAIDASIAGDTVLVSPGVYVENIDFRGKGIIVGSYFLIEPDTAHIHSTIIDGAQKGSVVSFAGGEDSTARLMGLTIRNGNGTLRNYSGVKLFRYGGGVFCENSSPALQHLLIVENHSAGGGRVFLKHSTAVLKNVEIRGNTAVSPIWEAPNVGGGMLLWDAHPRVDSSLIRANHSEIAGGAAYLLGSHPVFQCLEVSGNFSDHWGGGFFCESASRPIFMNVTIAGNRAGEGGGGINLFNNSSPVLANSILWSNIPDQIAELAGGEPSHITALHCNIEEGLPGIQLSGESSIEWSEKNIAREPRFVGPGISNYRLRRDSPCIDGGTRFLMVDGDTLLSVDLDSYSGTAPDIGRYEYVTNNIHPRNSSLTNRLPAKLKGDFPNPFNPTTTIAFELPHASRITLHVYDALGRKVATLINGHLSAGLHHVKWEAGDLPSGVYFYRLAVWPASSLSLPERIAQTRRMLLVR